MVFSFELTHAWCAQNGGYSVARSQSAAGVARPQRARSKSPRRSLSPPADRDWRYTGAARPRALLSSGLYVTTSAVGPRMLKIAGLDPARNTIDETRTFSRVRSLPLYCHYYLSSMLSTLIFSLTHLPSPFSFST